MPFKSNMRSRSLILALLLLTTCPSLAMMLLHASSQAAGLALGTLCVLLILWMHRGFSLPARTVLRRFRTALVLILVLTLHGVLARFFTGAFDWARASSSMVLVSLCYFGAYSLGQAVSKMHADQIVSAMRICFFIFVAEGALALLGVPALGHTIHNLPVIFFIEPSHYSLAFLPFVTFLVMAESGLARLGVVLVALLLGLLIKSLTLLVGLGIALMLVLPARHLILLVLCALPLGAFVDPEYFVERLAFSDDVTNLSALAYLQGWERAILNFHWTHGVGVGFQQFGLVGDLGEFQERIAELFAAEEVNLLDGGSNGSKLIGEFGIFGVLALLCYLVVTLLRLLQVRRHQGRTGQGPVHEYFFAACLLAPFTEFFVRGVGYMSAGMFLLLVGITASRPDPATETARNEMYELT